MVDMYLPIVNKILEDNLEVLKEIKKCLKLKVNQFKVDELLLTYMELRKVIDLNLNKLSKTQLINLGRVAGQLEALLILLKEKRKQKTLRDRYE